MTADETVFVHRHSGDTTRVCSVHLSSRDVSYSEGGVRGGGEYAYCRNARFLHSLLQSLLSAAEMLEITI